MMATGTSQTCQVLLYYLYLKNERVQCSTCTVLSLRSLNNKTGQLFKPSNFVPKQLI